ncbi:hypothetical protein [Neisseria montereyensis]|uniref:DNA-binding protein n=1 Tax=Neisseria montereyensis TaxID=2973938 RepID=A0ABT2FDL4_9NEIS|nr:hypothetical protein [Neisseria montereyensis]MCS4534272.1 hypothetical protein [Neisseria montereyensis]
MEAKKFTDKQIAEALGDSNRLEWLVKRGGAEFSVAIDDAREDWEAK